MKAPWGRGERDPRRPRAIGLLVRRERQESGPVVHGIKKERKRERKSETDTRHGKVEEKGRRGGRLETEETEETEESVCGPCRWLRGRAHLCQRSMARRRITGGKVTEERERHTGRRGREENERERERDR